MATEIAGRSPDAVRGAKALFNRLANAGAAEQFAEERRVIGGLIGGPNQVESVMANFEKRPRSSPTRCHDDENTRGRRAMTPTVESMTEKAFELRRLVKGADSIELKLTIPERSYRSAAEALGVDPLDAQIRQVFFFDTADLDLNKVGVVARARREAR